MKTRVVITGVGALSALGHTIDAIGAAAPLAAPVPGEAPAFRVIGEFAGSGTVGLRLKRKLDNFTFHGLCAADQALEASGVLGSGVDLDRVGVFVGNCLGGWGFTEPKLKALHTEGVDAMGPYVATAWFPAALQGQISLQHNLKGYSKTFSSSGVAGIQAIGYGVEAIETGRADVVLCGASEDLSSPYVRAMLLKGGARTGVFGQEETGDFAEGAAFMVLESYDRARARGANILCEVSGFADHFSSRAEDAAAVLEQNTRAVIGEARQDHLLLLDGGFQAEADNLRQEVGNVGLHLASSRATHGQMFAVSGVMETVLAARELRRGAITARSFAAGASNTPVGRVLVRRLGKQGSVSTLGLSAL
jgi:3-oxoacyl-[acyl-carrier-protein] synthase II